MLRIAIESALAISLLSSIGCGPEARNGAVSGTVTLDGAKVTAGTVTVLSADRSGMASAAIGPDGTYTIADAPVGEVRIVVRTSDSASIPGPGKIAAKDETKTSADIRMTYPKNPHYVATPAKYENSDTSGLDAMFPKPGRSAHVYNIELTAK